jgi:hypothetical protein
MVKPVVPEGAVAAHPVTDGCKRQRLGAVVRFASLLPGVHQLRVFQKSQMLGHGRLRYARPVRQSVYRLLAIAGQALKDPSPCGIGKCLENFVSDCWHD